MMRVFRDAGFQVSREFDEGVLHLEFDIDPTERSYGGPRTPASSAPRPAACTTCCTRARWR